MTSSAEPDHEIANVHASAVAWCGKGILLHGASGAGKSSLTARLLAMGGYLVADDLVRVQAQDRSLYASAVAADGLIELRGGGIFRLATIKGVRVSLWVELEPGSGGERLPERRCTHLLGVDLPLLVVDGHDPAAPDRILIALVAIRTA